MARLSLKVNVTKNYRLFRRSPENRQTVFKKRKKLLQSMKKYGFLSCYPIVCRRNSAQELEVRDGQHRLAIAESLGLPVYWIEEPVDFDVPTVNNAAKAWGLRDYAETYASQGKAAYQEGLDFAEAHGLPLGTAFTLLAGTVGWTNVREAFASGAFAVKDRKWADRVAGIYSPLVGMAKQVRNARFVEACMAVCRVTDFDPRRLVQNANRCRDKLQSYSTRDAYLDMLEEIYNFGRHQLMGVKAAALMALRERSAIP